MPEGLSAWVAQDRKALSMFKAFRQADASFVVSANTIVEVGHSGISMPRLAWALSQVKVEPVTQKAAGEAAKLLKAIGLHGDKYAIDATVAEAALRQPGPVVMLTSDLDYMSRLCGNQVILIGI